MKAIKITISATMLLLLISWSQRKEVKISFIGNTILSSSQGFSKINLYHLGKGFFAPAGQSSIQWLKENDLSLYHFGKGFAAAGGQSSVEWLKKNNLPLYHFGKGFFAPGGQSSVEWLKK